VDPTLLKNPGAQGLLASDVDFPFLTDNTPATEAFHAIVNKYTPQLKNYADTNVIWTGLQLLGAAVKAVGKAPVTSTSLKNALYSMKNQTLGGLAPPLNFAPGKINTTYCWFVLGIAHNKYVAPQGATPSCASKPVINAVFSGFLKSLGITN
jgi:branched-chain amino acid transport system substrate-binding protein